MIDVRSLVTSFGENNSIKSAIAFIEKVWQRLPVAFQRIETGNDSEFGAVFLWNLQDIGIARGYIPRGCPESNCKVEWSHSTDEVMFYRRGDFRTPQDSVVPLRAWEHEYYNRPPHLALRGRTVTDRRCEFRITDPHASR